ncbi:hypothetical protein FACS1894208_10340 [Clostridia bacterium]|nr:hypothetical protein FACS1894208_10340 [Clostridia bacterium]
MKKRIYALAFVAIVVVAMGATAFADPIDLSGINDSFSVAVQSTVDLLLGILPIALTVFALSFAIKKGVALVKTF